MGLTLGRFIILLIVGSLAGSLAGRVVTLSRTGYGPWINLGIGMIGALVGGSLFKLLGIDFGWGDLKISFEDLIAAFVGSLLCIVCWWLAQKLWVRRAAARKSTQVRA